YNIVIDAKLAFGTGTHFTTQMMLHNLLLQNIKPTTSVLDCGCGTGILSIAASKIGAAHVVGYDIDEWSVENSRHNADLNGIDNIEIHLGDASLLGTEINGSFDIVMANINRNILIADVSKFVSVMHTGSRLIVSGFYISDASDIADSFSTYGLSLVSATDAHDWQSLVFDL
ncbi:MAG: 50S ribosomal protein L11 methyltransferase, partial [Prevotellaceae bacterium]|nr:50S ribosomal protein L11 methyltransferase [Prevotellaceae bacterium]